MSTGKIKIPRNPDLPEDDLKKAVAKQIHQSVKTFEIEVEDKLWKEADKKLEEKHKKQQGQVTVKIDTLTQEISELKQQLGDNKGSVSDSLQLLEMEIEELKQRKPLDLRVTTDKKKRKDLGHQHQLLPDLLQILSTGLNVYLVGPSGAGKTHAARQCAEALGIDFYFTGAVASEFKLTGFIDANGSIVCTEFRKAYEKGGLFLFDELDASYPQAVLAFNAALANDWMDFPGKRVERHANFYCIAAANTFGQGADRSYVGRHQLDAASLDRFVFLDWQYDENLERALAGNDDWTDKVQRVRKVVQEMKIRHVVSPRASIFGAKLLAKGIDQEKVEATLLWKGLDSQTVLKIQDEIKPMKQMKAKHNGTFTCDVDVGDLVKKNQDIGTISTSDWSSSNYHVKASFTGKIKTLFLVGERVNEGDIIAEILVG